MQCLDLMKKYGKRYKVSRDPSWDAETAENRTEFRKSGEEPWYWELIGRKGRLYPHGETVCAVLLSPRISAKLERSSLFKSGEAKLKVVPDEGSIYLIPNATTDTVLPYLQPRKRRILSPEQRQKAIERLKAHSFPKKTHHDSIKTTKVAKIEQTPTDANP